VAYLQLGQTDKAVSKCSATEMEAIWRGTEALYQQLEQVLAKIQENVQKNCELAEQIARSPRAIKTIKDLDTAIANFTPTRQLAEYKISEYTTGNKHWRHAPSQHSVSIQDLLLHNIQTRQEKNKLLGEKIEKIVLQNQVLAQQASSIYDTPSEKLKKSPIMNILTKMVATYMFMKNMNNPRQDNTIWGHNLLQKEGVKQVNKWNEHKQMETWTWTFQISIVNFIFISFPFSIPSALSIFSISFSFRFFIPFLKAQLRLQELLSQTQIQFRFQTSNFDADFNVDLKLRDGNFYSQKSPEISNQILDH